MLCPGKAPPGLYWYCWRTPRIRKRESFCCCAVHEVHNPFGSNVHSSFKQHSNWPDKSSTSYTGWASERLPVLHPAPRRGCYVTWLNRTTYQLCSEIFKSAARQLFRHLHRTTGFSYALFQLPPWTLPGADMEDQNAPLGPYRATKLVRAWTSCWGKGPGT